jgi:hypothetical protein
MELVQNTAKDRFEAANSEMSKHCFEVGRLRYVIELDEEALEKKKIEYRNKRVDFDKLNKELQRASELFFGEQKEVKEVTPEIPCQ